MPATVIAGGISVYVTNHGPWEWWVTFLILVTFLAIAATPQLLWEKLHPERRDGECANCGYCLTGNVSGVCPECGTVVARKRPG